MKLDDWYKSAKCLKLRLLGHLASEILHKTQSLYDVLEIIQQENQEILVCDKFNLVERQLRVLNLEASKLIERCNDFDRFLTPKKFDEEAVG